MQKGKNNGFIRTLFVVILMMLAYGNSYAARAKFQPKPSEQVFVMTATFVRPSVIEATWHVLPGYYLYADRLHISFTPNVVASIDFPKPIVTKKEGHADTLYAGNIRVPVTLHTDKQQFTMSVSYQGCAKDGFCYPPIHKDFTINLNDLSITPLSNAQPLDSNVFSWTALLTDQVGVKDFMHDRHEGVILLIFLGLGLLLAFTPCVLPMVPILMSIILGQHEQGTRKAFLLSLVYVAGMSFTYAGAGLLTASLGSSLQVWLQQPITIGIVSGVFVLLALSLFGLYELRISHYWHNKIAAWSNQHEGGTYIGVFVMGVLSTLVVSPCVTAPLVGVLIYIGQTGNLTFGASALFCMGLGMGIPLLLIGISAGRWLPKSGVWMRAIKELFGIFMVAMAIWLLSRIISVAATLLLFGFLLLVTGWFVGIYLPRLIRFRTINQAIGLTVTIAGVLLLFNGVSMSITTPVSYEQTPLFTVVKDADELKKQLALAHQHHDPVIVDFYADWCQSCMEMDDKVFVDNMVRQALDHFVLLRVDLSKNTPADNALMQQLGVIAPPTMLFYNDEGQEVNSRRIVGELDVNEFLTRLNSFMTDGCDKKVFC